MKKNVAHARSRATGSERLEAAALNDAIRTAGLKCTAVRIGVLRYLDEHRGQPATFDDVAEALGLDRTSVFRALRDFVDGALARRVDLGDHVYRFELAVSDVDERGPTFTCERCGAS